jgi:nitrite reductase/ring-hydroxylating ferredoxin subunit
MTEQAVVDPFEGSAIEHVGTYRRVLPVALVRLYENALDWEHLPWLHASQFRSIEVIDHGAWGWRATVVAHDGSPAVIELRLDRALRRWITRNLEGPNRGAEIWTHAFEIGPARVDINVDFFVPGVPREARAKVGRAWARSYARLYDEDVAMMVERGRRLDERVAGGVSGSVAIGQVDEIEARLSAGRAVLADIGARRYRVARAGDRFVAFPAVCPHMLGPLDAAPVVAGAVRCPWHGLEFDIVSGECVSGRPCRFGPRPRVVIREGVLLLEDDGAS